MIALLLVPSIKDLLGADCFFCNVLDNNPLVEKRRLPAAPPVCWLRTVLGRGVIDGQNGIIISENAEDMTRVLTALHSDREKIRQPESAAEDLYISWRTASRAAARYQVVLETTRPGKSTIRGSDMTG